MLLGLVCFLRFLPSVSQHSGRIAFIFLTFLHPKTRSRQLFPEYGVKSECLSVQESCAHNTPKT